ncbi:MAG TPA: hypothetical protein VF104_07075 [Burkholderiales bacterium]
MPYYGPQPGQAFRGYTPGNPLAAYSLPYFQREYTNDHPEDYLSLWKEQPGQQPGQISSQYQQWRDIWLGQQPARYQAARMMDPELMFEDYMKRQDPVTAYELAHPYARGLKAMFGTRYVRGY